MKRSMLAIAVWAVTAVSVAHAQQPATPATPGADGMMPMEMCREMMMGGSHMMGGHVGGGHPMMGPGMMGGLQTSDPRVAAELMAMRGEMMKAMGDIMLKHAAKIRSLQPSTTK